MDQPKRYRSFPHWVLTTQLPFLLLHHSLAAYAVVVLIAEPVEEPGWAIAVWALVLGSVALFWLGNRWYWRKRLLPFMHQRR